MTRPAHDFDDWFWCRRCGLGAMQAKEAASRVCAPPSPGVLARRQLDAIVARAPLVMVADYVVARLEDDGILP